MTIAHSVLVTKAIILASVLLSACSVLPKPKPASTIYRLSIPAEFSAAPITQSKVVNIEYPTASKTMSGVDIIVSPDGRRLASAAGAQWAEPVPALLRNALIDILARNQNVTGIIPKGNTRVPYRLNINIRRFEAVFDQGEEAAPNAVIQLTLSLTETKARQLIGSYSVKAQKRADAPSISAIVHAQDVVAQKAMQDVSLWLTSQMLEVSNNPILAQN